MESRRRRGLFLVGEMLDVDGRVGGLQLPVGLVERVGRGGRPGRERRA